jgi:Tfp pilus assembly protein PilO
MLKERWDRSRIILAGAIVGAELLVCLYFALYSGRMRSAQTDRLAQARQELETLRNNAGQLTGLRKQYEDSRSILAHLEPGLPPERESDYMPTLLSQLQTLAQQTHIKLDVLTPGQKNPAVNPPPPAPATNNPPAGGAPPPGAAAPPASSASAAPETILVMLTLRGTFKNLLAFIERLKTFPKLLEISSVQLRPANAGAQIPGVEPELNISMSLNATILPVMQGTGL